MSTGFKLAMVNLFKTREVVQTRPATWQREDMLRSAYALNLCMVSLSQIVDYNSLDVLRNEYDAILNNLNMENVVKDDSLLAAFEKMLDVCHFFILHAKDKEMLKRKQELRLKGALSKALGGGNVIAILGSGNPWAIAAGAAAMIGVAAINYKSQRAQAKLENEIEEWELEKSALEQLHNLRRQLFETAWRLQERFGYPDEYRLTEKQIKIYDDIIKDPDPQNRYEQLELIQGYFKAYPVFWYYLGRAALETSEMYRIVGEGDRKRAIGDGNGDGDLYRHYVQKAKTALETFKKVHHGNALLREDILSASAYLDLAQLRGSDELDMMFDDVLCAKNLADTDVEVMQSCAFRFLQMHDMYARRNDDLKARKCKDEAEFCLKFLLSRDFNPELNGRILSRLYIKEAKEGSDSLSYKVLKACIGRKCSFVYQRMFPISEREFKDDWNYFLDNGGLHRTAYNFFYGYVWLENAAFLSVFNEAKATSSYKPLMAYKQNELSEEQTEQATDNQSEAQESPAQAQQAKQSNCESHSATLFDSLFVEDNTDEDAKAIDSARKVVRAFIRKTAKEGKMPLKAFDKQKLGLLDGSYERDWRKLWFGIRASQFNENEFSIMEKHLLNALKDGVKEIVEQYVSDFKNAYSDSTNCTFEAITAIKTEPEAILAVIELERAAEKFRVQIQEMLPGNKRFWYPDPKFPSNLLAEKNRQVKKELGEAKKTREVAFDVAQETRGAILHNAMSIRPDVTDRLKKEGIGPEFAKDYTNRERKTDDE